MDFEEWRARADTETDNQLQFPLNIQFFSGKERAENGPQIGTQPACQKY